MRIGLACLAIAAVLGLSTAEAAESLSCAAPGAQALPAPADRLLETAARRGDSFRPRAGAARVQLIYFGAAWCAPCRLQVRAMRDLYESGEPDLLGYEVVFISRDDTDEEAAAYVKAERMPWRYVPPGAKGPVEALRTLGRGSLPDMVAVDAQGRVLCGAYSATGHFLGASEVLEAVRRELAVSPR